MFFMPIPRLIYSFSKSILLWHTEISQNTPYQQYTFEYFVVAETDIFSN